jgi:hypothetical protein
MASLQIPLSPILDHRNLAQRMPYYKPQDDVSGVAHID